MTPSPSLGTDLSYFSNNNWGKEQTVCILKQPGSKCSAAYLCLNFGSSRKKSCLLEGKMCCGVGSQRVGFISIRVQPHHRRQFASSECLWDSRVQEDSRNEIKDSLCLPPVKEADFHPDFRYPAVLNEECLVFYKSPLKFLHENPSSLIASVMLTFK